MDSQDSQSSIEKDLITALSKEAAILFRSRKYADCFHVLQKLLQKKPDDPRVLHNIAISDYFQDGFSDPKKLLEALTGVKKRSQELAHASKEQADTGISNGSGTMSNQISPAIDTNVARADEYDTSVASLNMAVILFSLHEYTKAKSALETLYQNIGPIDETIAIHICLLFLDAALASHDARKSADLINYLDNAFNVGFTANQVDDGSIVQQKYSNVVLKSSSVQASIYASVSDSAGCINATEISLSRTSSDDTIDYESLSSALDIGEDNLFVKTLTDQTMSMIDLKLKLQLCKVQFLLLTRNHKAGKRAMKEAMNMTRGRDSSMALLLKSQLEYACGNHRKAIKLLIASTSPVTEAGISSIFNNNFGCVYYKLQKHHTSNIFYSKALSNSTLLRKENPQKLLTFSQSLLITYNCGMQHLACGRPIPAAHCFKKASQVFNKKPLLWVRIAECCLMAFKEGLLKSSETRVNVVGKGKWRQLVIEDWVSNSIDENSVERNDKQPELSMSYALQCLVNALHLLNCEAAPVKSLNYKKTPNNDSKPKEQNRGTTLHDLLSNSILDYEDICRKENRMVKQAVLANMGYIELVLENPLKALSIATSLLSIPECSRVYIFLGHVYAAEALCLLNRPNEASEHLSMYLSEENNFQLPYKEDDCEQWNLTKHVDESANGTSFSDSQDTMFLKPEEAQGELYVNFAAMCAVQGDLEMAHQLVKQALSIIPSSKEAILTAIYVDIRLGNTEEAVAKLKQCRLARCLQGSLPLDSALTSRSASI